MIEKIISIIIILILAYILNLILEKLINKLIDKKNNKNLKTTLIFFKKIKTVIIFSLGVTLCLSKFEMFKSLSVTLLSAVGILTTILGLAAKESLGNLFGSISILFSHPFEVGDRVKIIEKDISGTVLEVSMRHTIILGYNNQRYIIPNSILNTLTIENNDYNESETCLFADYGISYESDIDKAIDIIKKELNKFEKPNIKNIEYPKVRVYKWDSSSIILRAWVWGKDVFQSYDNLYKLNYNLKKEFDKNNIEIPYNHLNVIMEDDKDTK